MSGPRGGKGNPRIFGLLMVQRRDLIIHAMDGEECVVKWKDLQTQASVECCERCEFNHPHPYLQQETKYRENERVVGGRVGMMWKGLPRKIRRQTWGETRCDWGSVSCMQNQ